MKKIVFVAVSLITAVFMLSANASEEWQWAPSQPIGSILPEFEASDSNGVIRNIRSLKGSNGTLLFFIRSTNW